MKTTPFARLLIFTKRSVAGGAFSVLLAGALSADESTWSADSSANWSTAAWSPAGVPSGAGWIVNIDRSFQEANRILTIDTMDQTVGELHAWGANSSSLTNTLAASGGATLTLDNLGEPARISSAGWGSFTISAPLLLLSDLELANNPDATRSESLTLAGLIGAATPEFRTITTMASAVAPSDPNDHRIVVSGSIIDGAGQVAIVHNSGNNLLLQSRTNSFSGGLTINSSPVIVGSDGSGSYGDGALGAVDAPITFNGGSLSFSASSGNPTIEISQRFTALDAGGGTLDVAFASDTVIWNGTIVGWTLTKTGPGTLILAGTANDYLGGTVISGGTLVAANNTALGTNPVTAASGTLSLNDGVTVANYVMLDGGVLRATSGTATYSGVVRGIGTVGAADSVLRLSSTAVIAPADYGAGLMTIDGAVTLEAGSSFEWECMSLPDGDVGVAGTNYDQLVLTSTGALTIASGTNFTISFGDGVGLGLGNPFWASNRSWTIISNLLGGSVTGSAFTIDNSNWAWEGTFSTSFVGGNVVLNWAPIPEPSTYAAILGAFALIGVMAARRRR